MLVTALVVALSLSGAATALAAGVTVTQARIYIQKHSARVTRRFHPSSKHLNGVTVAPCKRSRNGTSVKCTVTATYQSGTSCSQKVRVSRTPANKLRMTFVGPAGCIK